MATNQQILDKLEEIAENSGCKGDNCPQYKTTKTKINIFTLFIGILIFVAGFGYNELGAFKKEVHSGIEKEFQSHVVKFVKMNETVKQNSKDIEEASEACEKVEELIIRADAVLEYVESKKDEK